eukprot:gene19818-23567_t
MSSNISIQRICEHCGKPFRAKTTVTRFCSPRCNGRHAKQKIRDLKIKVSDTQVKENLTSVVNHPILIEFLTIKQAAQLLGLCTKTLYNIIQRGKIKAVRLSSRKIIIKRTEIDKIFEQPEFVVPVREKPKKNPHPKYCYTMAQAQDIFNCSEKALYDMIKRNKLSKFQNGWYTYVLKHSLILDYYPPLKNPINGNPKRFEALKLYVFDNPSDQWEREHNKETMILARTVCSQRQLDKLVKNSNLTPTI